jgi:hypothetical protein
MVGGPSRQENCTNPSGKLYKLRWNDLTSTTHTGVINYLTNLVQVAPARARQMRTPLALLPVLVFGPLAVFASNPEGGIQDDPAAPTSGSFGDGTALYEQWPQLGSVPVNRTEGLVRREKRQPKTLLEARQANVSAWFQNQSGPASASLNHFSYLSYRRVARIRVTFSSVLSRIRLHAANQSSPFVRLFSSFCKVKHSFPTGCHTSTCCPAGTFCVGQSTCCQLGAVACGEGSSAAARQFGSTLTRI